MIANVLKPTLIFAALVCFEMTVDAQWQPSGATTGNIYYNNGNVGIGASSIVSRLTLLNGEGSLLSAQTNYPGNNKIFEVTQESSDGFLYLRNAVGTTVTKLSGYSATPSFFNSNVGIGTTTPEANLHVGKQEAPSNSNGEIVRLALQPYGHTGGPWKFVCRDVPGKAYLDLFYGSGQAMTVQHNGNVGFGITNPGDYKINVWGKIRAHEIVVNTTGADFVFEPTYKLRSLSELETFIKANKHLPEIPPAKEMQENGISAGEMQAKLLQKVEELTLYMIEKDKEIQKLEEANEQLRVDSLCQQLEQLKKIAQLEQLIMEMKSEIGTIKENQ